MHISITVPLTKKILLIPFLFEVWFLFLQYGWGKCSWSLRQDHNLMNCSLKGQTKEVPSAHSFIFCRTIRMIFTNLVVWSQWNLHLWGIILPWGCVPKKFEQSESRRNLNLTKVKDFKVVNLQSKNNSFWNCFCWSLLHLKQIVFSHKSL